MPKGIGSCVIDFSVNQSRSIGDASTDCADPSREQQATSAPRQQPEFLRQRHGATSRCQGGITIADKLVAYAEVVERIPETIWMVQRFGESDRRRAAFLDLFAVTTFLQRDGAAQVSAHSWIVATEGVAKMTMAGHVIALDTDTAVVQNRRDIASEQCRRPATMVGLKQLIPIARTLRERHQFVCPVARQGGLEPDNDVEPQAHLAL